MTNDRNIAFGLHDPCCLGDGLYVGHDGYHVWLRAERDGMVHSVALEPIVLRSFDAYCKRLHDSNLVDNP